MIEKIKNTVINYLQQEDNQDNFSEILSSAYGRYEFTEKSAEELVLDEDVYSHDAVFNVHALTLGYNYDLLYFNKTRLAIGGNFTVNQADSKPDNLYSNNPMSFQVYLRLYPELMRINR